MSSSPPVGFLLIDKEQGWTSHDVVAKVRSALGGKIGHAGTLDPMATGLLVLGVGRATKLLRYIQGGRKEYLATAQLGVATDTLDADGAILSRDPLPVTEEQVASVMERFTGDVMQIPPMVSARKVEGKRLYELAREGKVVEREAREVTIDRLELIDFAPSDYPQVTFRTVCTTGTYVRTLADDIARALGGRAHLVALRRVRNGAMVVHDACTVETAVTMAREGHLVDRIMSPWDALSEMGSVVVDDATQFRVRNGRAIPLSSEALGDETFVEGEAVRMGNASGGLLAVYRRDGDSLLPEVVLS